MAIVALSPFAKLLRRFRLDAELTQEELAEQAGLSARAISDLERGVKLRPHRATVDLLADALQLTAEDRAALVAAVPRPTGSRAAESPLMSLLATSVQHPQVGPSPVQCPKDLRQALEGLVGLYVDEAVHDRRINVAVIVFSVGEPITAE